MFPARIIVKVRQVQDEIGAIDIQGDLNRFAEQILTQAYQQVITHNVAVILNFEGLNYMNSSGIGLLVTILVRAQKESKRFYAWGLKPHYQHLFELTRLNEVLRIYKDEAQAVEAALAETGQRKLDERLYHGQASGGHNLSIAEGEVDKKEKD